MGSWNYQEFNEKMVLESDCHITIIILLTFRYLNDIINLHYRRCADKIVFGVGRLNSLTHSGLCRRDKSAFYKSITTGWDLNKILIFSPKVIRLVAQRSQVSTTPFRNAQIGPIPSSGVRWNFINALMWFTRLRLMTVQTQEHNLFSYLSIGN